MKINVDKKELLEAVEKAAVGCKEYRVTISKQKNAEGKNLCTITSSNGIIMAIITFTALVDGDGKFIVGSEFYEALKAVGEFGDQYTIDIRETAIEISAGSACMPLPLKEKDSSFKLQTPNKDGCVSLSFDKDTFVKSIRQGSYAFGDENSKEGLKSAVALQPVVDGENKKVNIYSSDGRMAVRASEVILEASEGFKESLNMLISLDAPSLRSLCNKLESEKINLMIFSKQISIKDGTDIYTILRYEAVFPAQIGILLEEEGYNFKAKFDASTLKAALKVATLLEDSQNKVAVIDIHKGAVTISSKLGNNTVQVKAEDIDGEIKVAINARHLDKTISEIGAEKVTIFGLGELKPVYIKADGVKALTTPVKLSTAQ